MLAKEEKTEQILGQFKTCLNLSGRSDDWGNKNSELVNVPENKKKIHLINDITFTASNKIFKKVTNKKGLEKCWNSTWP